MSAIRRCPAAGRSVASRQTSGGNYPFVAEPVDPFDVESLEFLEPDHPVYALRPADPLEIVGASTHRARRFAYPGGESVLD